MPRVTLGGLGGGAGSLWDSSGVSQGGSEGVWGPLGGSYDIPPGPPGLRAAGDGERVTAPGDPGAAPGGAARETPPLPRLRPLALPPRYSPDPQETPITPPRASADPRVPPGVALTSPAVQHEVTLAARQGPPSPAGHGLVLLGGVGGALGLAAAAWMLWRRPCAQVGTLGALRSTGDTGGHWGHWRGRHYWGHLGWWGHGGAECGGDTGNNVGLGVFGSLGALVAVSGSLGGLRTPGSTGGHWGALGGTGERWGVLGSAGEHWGVTPLSPPPALTGTPDTGARRDLSG